MISGQSLPESEDRAQPLTDSKILARNILINLLGYGAPLLAAVFAIPVLMGFLGTARFGILSLIWVFFGYLGLLDLGLGRSLTQMVARELGGKTRENIPSIVWTGSALLTLLGMLLTALSWFFLPFLVSLLRIPAETALESLWAFRILMLSLPFLLLSVGLRGVLEAFQKFSATNAVRIPMGVFMFLGPVMILPFSSTLTAISAVLALGRVASCAAYCIICPVLVPDLKSRPSLRLAVTGRLLGFGGWVTLTNIINPLLFYIERFLIASLLSATAVAYYATPNEIITKLLLLSSAAIGVLYPAFASSYSFDRSRTETLFLQGAKYLAIVILPIAMLVTLYAEEGLELWMGYDFAHQSAPVLKWLCPGVLILSLGHIPYALIQGVGRPDIVAKIHLLELPLYLGALYWSTLKYGIVGAAAVWTIRALAETSLFYLIALRILRLKVTYPFRLICFAMVSISLFSLFATLRDMYLKALVTAVFLSAYLFTVWHWWLSSREKSLVQGLFQRSRKSGDNI